MIYRRKNKLKLIINRTKLFWNIKSYNTIPTDLGTKAFRCLRCVTNEPNFISVFPVTRLSKRKDEERVQVDRTDNIKFKSSVLRQATSDIPPRQTSSTSSLLVIVGFPFLPLYIREGHVVCRGTFFYEQKYFANFTVHANFNSRASIFVESRRKRISMYRHSIPRQTLWPRFAPLKTVISSVKIKGSTREEKYLDKRQYPILLLLLFPPSFFSLCSSISKNYPSFWCGYEWWILYEIKCIGKNVWF